MAFLIFVLTLFGVKILMAEGDPKKDTFILLLKIAVVIGFLASYDELIIDPSFAIMQEGVEITTSAFEGTTVNEKCQPYLDKYPDAEKPWIHYDCIIGQLFGFGGDVFVGASALGVVSVALFSGQFGSAIFLSAVAALFFILKLVIRGCYSYLMAVFAMAVLLFISPLLIPLIWMPITQQYFDRWLGALMAMMVIPAIVMAYLTMSFIILDRVFFDEEMGIATLLSKEKIEKMRMAPQCSNTTVAGSPATNNITNKQAESDSHFNWNNPLLSANASTGLFNCLYTIDFRSDEAGTINKLFFAFVVLSLVTYILMLMLNAIISMAQLMMGGGYFMQSAVMGEDGEGNVFERTLSNTQSSMNKSLSGASSANDFVGGVAKGIAGIPRDIANAFGGKKS
jgi:type IV secretory pathway VirB6-like protein